MSSFVYQIEKSQFFSRKTENSCFNLKIDFHSKNFMFFSTLHPVSEFCFFFWASHKRREIRSCFASNTLLCISHSPSSPKTSGIFSSGCSKPFLSMNTCWVSSVNFSANSYKTVASVLHRKCFAF